MDVAIHRVNTIAGLSEVDPKYGVELDIRSEGSNLILNHEPFAGGDSFVDYLAEYDHGIMVLNIKEAGIEDEVLRLVREKGVAKYFLLDVEFPYIYRASRAGERSIAMRYSEDECIETVLKYEGMLDWVWVDTISRLPLDSEIVSKLASFKTCLVCPERWARPEDIPAYIEQMKSLGFQPDAVMTASAYADQWQPTTA